MNKKLQKLADRIGCELVYWFHMIALFAIGGAIVWSAIHSFIGMMGKGAASIDDILLLFIYLELGAMVGLYFSTKRMPVTFLLYIVITALTRVMVGYVSTHHTPELIVLYPAGAILILTLAVLVLKYGSHTYPTKRLAEENKIDGVP